MLEELTDFLTGDRQNEANIRSIFVLWFQLVAPSLAGRTFASENLLQKLKHQLYRA